LEIKVPNTLAFYNKLHYNTYNTNLNIIKEEE